MEVRETAACGISKREFAIEFEAGELINVYRVMHYAQKGIGFYDEDFLEEVAGVGLVAGQIEQEGEQRLGVFVV